MYHVVRQSLGSSVNSRPLFSTPFLPFISAALVSLLRVLSFYSLVCRKWWTFVVEPKRHAQACSSGDGPPTSQVDCRKAAGATHKVGGLDNLGRRICIRGCAALL